MFIDRNGFPPGAFLRITTVIAWKNCQSHAGRRTRRRNAFGVARRTRDLRRRSRRRREQPGRSPQRMGLRHTARGRQGHHHPGRLRRMMRIVVITPPHAVPREAATIRLLLDAGIDRVHIRKPEASREELCALLEAIPEPLRPRLSLHDGHCLAIQYGIGGVHLNARNPLSARGLPVRRQPLVPLARRAGGRHRLQLPLPQPDLRQHLEKRLPRGLHCGRAPHGRSPGGARRPDAGPGRHHARPPCGRARLWIRRRGPAGFDLAAALTRSAAPDHRQNHCIQKLITIT